VSEQEIEALNDIIQLQREYIEGLHEHLGILAQAVPEFTEEWLALLNHAKKYEDKI